MTMFLAAFMRFARDPRCAVDARRDLGGRARGPGGIGEVQRPHRALATAGVVLGWQMAGAAESASHAAPRADRSRVGAGRRFVEVRRPTRGDTGTPCTPMDRRRTRSKRATTTTGTATTSGRSTLVRSWRASAPGGPRGVLTTLPVYRSVWTTLYGMAWGDLSFLLRRHGRIEDPEAPYPWKHIPSWLTGTVLFLGLVPTVLAAAGLVSTIARRDYLSPARGVGTDHELVPGVGRSRRMSGRSRRNTCCSSCRCTWRIRSRASGSCAIGCRTSSAMRPHGC
jgi:hypothetical protein